MQRMPFLLIVILMLLSCKQESKPVKYTQDSKSNVINTAYAEGFTITTTNFGYKLTVSRPWQGASQELTYHMVKKESRSGYAPVPAVEVITIPIDRLVATSTTHIPGLELLEVEHTLKGFPTTDFISSPDTRKLIDQGQVKELGTEGRLDVETVLSLKPDAVLGYAVDSENRNYRQIIKAGIPVVYNGEWTETHPLGRAEWIKVYGVLYDKLAVADSVFNSIENRYRDIKNKVNNSDKRPTVVAGAPWKGTWYAPAGESWQALMLEDAGADYIYAETKGTGSLSYDSEKVINDASSADYWIAPGQFTSYTELKKQVKGAELFNAFESKRIYTFADTKGATGGVIYYEEASMRPDKVLADLVHYMHPDLDLEISPTFFQPLADKP